MALTPLKIGHVNYNNQVSGAGKKPPVPVEFQSPIGKTVAPEYNPTDMAQHLVATAQERRQDRNILRHRRGR